MSGSLCFALREKIYLYNRKGDTKVRGIYITPRNGLNSSARTPCESKET